MKLKAIIVDIGGVIVDIDDQAALDYLVQQGIAPPEQLLHRLNPVCKHYETGNIDTHTFLDALYRAHGNTELTKEQIKTTWEHIIVNLPVAQFTLLKQLQQQLPLYALSNTNVLHWQRINRLCVQHYDCTFSSLFTKAYLSYEVGLLKPTAEIYTLLLQETGLSAQNCLFIDDRKENLTTAQQLGFQTLHAPTLLTPALLSTIDKTLITTNSQGAAQS